ncbi:MAG: PH domain-containing protein [Dysgonamonadaceae bacterium]|nr:PH domain-containing protein [Dysgonamonadaceae bacterium]
MNRLIKKVEWGLSVKVITVIVLVILIIGEYFLIHSMLDFTNWILSIIVFAIPVLCIYCICNIPRFIEINEKELVLKKLWGKLIIDIDTITDVECYKPNKSDLRLFGSSGFFGYTGLFWNADIGKYRVYIGNISQAFLIHTECNKIYVFSCTDRNLVINAIKNKIQ